MKTLILFALVASLATAPLLAQNNGQGQQNQNRNQTQSTDTNTRFWEARLPGGNYMVALNRITSVSMHSYTIGTLAVTEVVIDTDGNSLARFYAADAAGANSQANVLNNTLNRGKELIQQGGSRAGVSTAQVVKDYPNTTHSKTVEYNMEDAASLNALYNSIKKAWERNKGGRFTKK